MNPTKMNKFWRSKYIHDKKFRKFFDRFIAKIKIDSTTGCWIWTKCSNSQGYGRSRFFDQSTLFCHVISYRIFVRKPIKLVCHKCDNPPCINPSHLFHGTHKDNAVDMKIKNRSATKINGRHVGSAGKRWNRDPNTVPRGDKHYSKTHPEKICRGSKHKSVTKPESVPRGERSGNAKLTNEKVLLIRELWDTGKYYQREIADKFGITSNLVSQIVLRKAWKHV